MESEVSLQPHDWSPPGSSIHGILQARILEWVAISFSRGSSQPRNQTQASHIVGRCFTIWATRENGIPGELFQILKDDSMKALHSICQQIWKTQQWPQNWKRSVFIPVPKKGNAKECSNYRTIALISHTSKVMLKILQARLQQFVNRELPDVQAGFRKGRGNRDQIANIRWIVEKEESSRKTSISSLLTMPKTLTVWITINCGKFFKRWE